MHNFISLTQTERKVVLDGIKITLADSKARAARTVIAATENVERHEEALAGLHKSPNYVSFQLISDSSFFHGFDVIWELQQGNCLILVSAKRLTT